MIKDRKKLRILISYRTFSFFDKNSSFYLFLRSLVFYAGKRPYRMIKMVQRAEVMRLQEEGTRRSGGYDKGKRQK
jgi:hypothetical protein